MNVHYQKIHIMNVDLQSFHLQKSFHNTDIQRLLEKISTDEKRGGNFCSMNFLVVNVHVSIKMMYSRFMYLFFSSFTDRLHQELDSRHAFTNSRKRSTVYYKLIHFL